MHAEDLLTTSPTAEAVAAEVARLPSPSPEALEALRRKLESSEQPPVEREWPPILQAPRNKKDSRYAEPATSHRPVVGPVLVLAKRAFRLAFQPFINEVLRRQVEFNEAILDSLATLHEHQQVQSRTQSLWRKEVEERLATLERPAPPGESSQKAARSTRR